MTAKTTTKEKLAKGFKKSSTSAERSKTNASPLETEDLSKQRRRLAAMLAGRLKPTKGTDQLSTSTSLKAIAAQAKLPPDPSLVTTEISMVKKRVTAAMAERWLRSAGRNRKLDGREVSKYARIMIRGDWEDYHPQGWVFSKDGEMLEGQHRAAALMKAAETKGEDFHIGVLLLLGFDKETQETIDTGKSRTMAQTADIIGLSATPADIALTKALWIDPSPGSKVPRVTDYEKVFDAFQQYQDGIKLAGQKHGAGSVSLSAIRAVIARAYYHCPTEADRERLSRFIEVMDTGLSTGEDEFPPVLVRGAYQALNSSGERAKIELYRKTQTAVHAYLNGETLKRLKQTKRQLFPLVGFEADS